MSDYSLTIEEQKQLEKVMADAERNKSEAQKLALDAGKLLTITADRLADYKDRGFFKRCWYKVSGKQGSLDRANQSDLISMQKYAWAYLMRLQEQNLLEAQAIAVIRNNLKDLQSETAEIHDMISVIVQKFDARIKNVEDKTALLDWKNHVSANISKFDRDLPTICSVQVAFDCLRMMRSGGIKYGEVNVDEYVYTVLKDVLGLDPDKSITVEEFVSALYGEVESFGLAEFEKTVTIKIAGEPLKPEYILENVTGAGYNALYQFIVEMNKMKSLADQLTGEGFGAVAKTAMLNAVKASLNNGSTSYSINELLLEVVGGSLLAEEILCEEKGIPTEIEESAPVSEFDINSLINDYVDISGHVFLDTNPTENEKQVYLESFAIVYASKGVYKGSHYLTSLARLFGCGDAINRLELLVSNPKKLDIQAILKVMATDARKYSWCVDAMFVGNEDGVANARVKSAVVAMCKAMNLKENEVLPFIEKAELLVSSKEPIPLLDAINTLNRRTTAWQSIVDFKRISLRGAFTDLRNRMYAKWSASLGLTKRFCEASMSVSDCAFTVGDENFLQKGAYAVMRMSCVSKFKSLKQEAIQFVNSVSGLVSEANAVLSTFGTKNVFCPHEFDLVNIEADEITSLDNENWGDNMERAFGKLERFVDETLNAMDLLTKQLDLYECGKYHESAKDNEEAKKAAEKKQRADAEIAKRTVTISRGDKSATISLAFEQVKAIPFSQEDVKYICPFNGKWYISVSKAGSPGAIFESVDGASWIKTSIPSIFEVNADINITVAGQKLILWYWGAQKFCFSDDGADWCVGEFPATKTYYYAKGIFFHEDKWFVQTCEEFQYSYVEKGIIFDSTETSTSERSVFYTSTELSGNWEKVSGLRLSEGVTVQNGVVFPMERGLLATSALSNAYASNKHIPQREDEFIFAFGKMEWRTADIQYEKPSFGSQGNSDNSGRFMACDSGFVFAGGSPSGIYHSEDGTSWTKVYDGSVWSPTCLRIGNLLGFASGKSIYVSVDGKTFVEWGLEHAADAIASNRDVVVLVDKDRVHGGLFVGKIKIS